MTTPSILSGKLDAYHWQPPVKYKPADMQDALSVLESIEVGHQYWIGDALIFAKDKFGEEFTQMIPEGKEETWRQYLWVCERVCPAIRRCLAGYTHARLIARVSHEEQEDLVATGIKGMTSRELDQKVKERTGKPKSASKKPEAPEPESLYFILKNNETELTFQVYGTELSLYRVGDGKPCLVTELKPEDPNTLDITNLLRE